MPLSTRPLLANLLTAGAYILTAKLYLLLSLTTHSVNLMWPPAGVALAAVLVLGYRIWPGLILGGVVLGLWRSMDETGSWLAMESLLMIGGVGMGTALQAVTGAWLVRSYVGSPGPLDTARDIALYILLGGVVACVINALVGSLLLTLVGWLPALGFLDTFWRWWLGDVLGAIIVSPLLLTLGAEPHKVWRSRRLTLAIPVLAILALAISSFRIASDRERAQLARVLERQAVRIADGLDLHFQQYLDGLESAADLMHAADRLDPQLMDDLTSRLLVRLPGVQALHWLPRTPHGGMPRSSDVVRLPDEPDFSYAVRQLVSGAAAEESLATVQELEQVGTETMRRARDTGRPALTAPVVFDVGPAGPDGRAGPARPGLADAGQGDEGDEVAAGVWLLVPVYERHARHHTPDDRRRSLRGFVAGKIALGQLVEDMLVHVNMTFFTMRFLDQTEPDRIRLLHVRDMDTPFQSEPRGQARLEVGGRRWHVVLTPTLAAIQALQVEGAEVLLAAGLFVAALLGALLLLITGHTARIEAQAVEHARARSQAERALEENRFLRRLVDSNVLGITVGDIDGRVIEANDAFLQIVGYAREDLQSASLRWDRMTPPEWSEIDAERAAQLRANGIAPAWEKEYLRKDGSRVPVIIGIANLDAPGQRHVAFIADLSQVKEAEAELKRRTAELERYKAIVNSAPMAIYAKEYSDEREGVFILANPLCSQTLGIENLAGFRDSDFVPEDIAAMLHENDRQILRRGVADIVEEMVPDHQTGALKYFISTKVPLFDAEGRPYAIGGISLEITELKLLTERLRALVDALPDVMFRVNTQGKILDFKNNRDNALGLTEDMLVGQGLQDTSLPADGQRLITEAVARAVASGDMQELEYSRRTRQGQRHFEARIVKSGTSEAVVLVRDITEARRTRAALESINARLRQANAELQEFAYVASHDLQEPLRTVRSFVDLLERRYGNAFDDKGQKWLELIVTGTQRMRALIDDLLAYSRAGQAASTELVDINKLVHEILGDMRASIEATGAEILVGELPALVANETELRQVFQNLISNALKFRRPDIKPRVSIRAELIEPPGRDWTFLVADNGIGIEPQYHERIFQVFQRLHGRDSYPGTGIGLAVVKKIIERRGGEVSVHSMPGEGTTFRFMLPASPELDGPESNDTGRSGTGRASS